jgi:hypothetical protein
MNTDAMNIRISLILLGMILAVATTGLVTTTSTMTAFAENDGTEGRPNPGEGDDRRNEDNPAAQIGGGSPGEFIDDNDKGDGCGSGFSDEFGGGNTPAINSGGKC